MSPAFKAMGRQAASSSFWPRRSTTPESDLTRPAVGLQPDELRLRLLGLADFLAAVGASASLALAPYAGLAEAFWALVFAPAWILLARLQGLYHRDVRSLRHLTVDEIPSVLVWALTATGTVAVALLLTPAGSLHVAAALQLWLVAATAALVLRASARFLWRMSTPPLLALIVGHGPLADAILRKLELFPDIHVRAAGQLASAEELLADLGLLRRIDRVVLVGSETGVQQLEEVLAECRQAGAELIAVLPPLRAFGSAARLQHVADLPVFTYEAIGPTRTTTTVKRGLDIAIASLSLILLSPLFALVAVAIRLGSAGPAFFRQERVGLHGEPFCLIKFRTMVDQRQAQLRDVAVLPARTPVVKVRPDDPRITRLGRLLRRTSIDELPQLWNVLRGDMSMVGPRPELPELVSRWPPEHLVRLSVKPGLTGPMQVYGRSDLTFEEWLAVEREYIENPSIWRDLRILVLTVPVAVAGRGAF